MVKRYDSDMDAPRGMERNDKQGYWVEFSDYQLLKAALREALQEWDSWNRDQLEGPGGWIGGGGIANARIAELHKFLDDK